MKKILLILSLAMMMLSCQSLIYGYQPVFTMGMSEKDFVEKNNNKQELVLATEDGNKVFRVYSTATVYKFFYFKNEKLVRFEEGTNPDDYKFNWVP